MQEDKSDRLRHTSVIKPLELGASDMEFTQDVKRFNCTRFEVLTHSVLRFGLRYSDVLYFDQYEQKRQRNVGTNLPKEMASRNCHGLVG